MINGLHIQMTSAKLKAIFEERAQYHSEKAAWYGARAKDLKEEMPTLMVSNNPTDSLVQSQRTHEGKATFFLLLAQNIIPDEIYRLSDQDCLRVELYSQYFH